MAKSPKAVSQAQKSPDPVMEAEADDRIGLDLRPAALDKARAHLTTRLRRLILESIYSASEFGAVYRTVRDIQALDMVKALQPDVIEAPAAPEMSVEELAEQQRKAHDAHKAEEARKAARGD